jgi:3-deoxy-manno-octulosonate cytidylyltransferase (CMP-KDO synthetase)
VPEPERVTKVVAIIPARFGATRLPGKPLADIHGRPLIQHVYERARRARGLLRVLVATDDARIVEAVTRFGGDAVLTSPDHTSGSDRLAEAAAGLDADVLVNVQGDEPMLDPLAIEAAVEPLLREPELPMATLSVPIGSAEEMLDPGVVKVVCDTRGDALYFSRSPIPFVRQGAALDLRAAAAEAVARGLARRHLGLYAFRREALSRFAALPPSPLELAEGLERVRALLAGAA